MTKHPLHLSLLLVPSGVSIFYIIRGMGTLFKIAQNPELFTWGIMMLIMDLIWLIPLLAYFILLIFIIRKKVNNKWINRASVLGWISVVIGAYGAYRMFTIAPEGLQAMGDFLMVFGILTICFIVFIISGTLFKIGFSEREKFINKP